MRKIGIAAGIALLLAGLAGGLPASGQTDELGGYTLTATAGAVRFVYDQPGSAVPATPTGEMTAPYTFSTLESGPTAHGLASALWPGDAGANAPAYVRSTLIAEFVRNGFPPQYVQYIPEVPNYPVRAETFAPQGPFDDDRGVPGAATMSARARDQEAFASSMLAGGSIRDLLTIGGMTSRSQAIVRGSSASAIGRAEVTGIDLLNGLVKAESVVTEATAASDGDRGSQTGRTTITGLKVQDQSMILDEQGLRAGGTTQPVGATINMIAEQNLKQRGVSLVYAPPQSIVDGPFASRSAGGLLVTIDFGTYRNFSDQLLNAVPQLKQLYGGEATLSILIGGVAVSAVASPVFAFEEDFALEPESFVSEDTNVLGDTLSGGGFAESGGGSFTSSTPDAPAGGDAALAAGSFSPSAVPGAFGGLPFALVGILALMAAGGARGLHVLCGRLLAPKAAGVACPLEGGSRG